MSHPRFEMVLADESVLFGHYKVNSQFAPLDGTAPASLDFELVDLYHKAAVVPDPGQRFPTAEMVTCLDAMIPAVQHCAWPFEDLAQAIWATISDTQLRVDIDDLDKALTQPARLLDGESDGD